MNRSTIFIIIPMICYLTQAAICWHDGDRPHSLVWFSYGFANVGFIWYEATK